MRTKKEPRKELRYFILPCQLTIDSYNLHLKHVKDIIIQKSEPFKFNLDSIDEVSIGDFYFIDPDEMDQGSIPTTRPLLCKVMEIDMELEVFTAEWWTMVSLTSLYIEG